MKKTEIIKIIEDSLDKKKGIKILKEAAVNNQSYELAAQLRNYEKSTFPEEVEKDEKEREKVREIVIEDEKVRKIADGFFENVISARVGLETMAELIKEKRKILWDYIKETYPETEGWNWTYSKDTGVITRTTKV